MTLLRDAALAIPPLRRLHESRDALANSYKLLEAENKALRAQLSAAQEQARVNLSPFFHFHTSFDAVGCMHRHAVEGLQPSVEHLTNFLGVRIAPKFFPQILAERAGQVEGTPIPANWHADIAEWAVALRAVELAGKSFTMIELGCGWGCWMNNTGVAARRTGRAVHLIGVEGDEGHVDFANEALATNGFAPDQITLHRGIAAATDGFALFPRAKNSGEVWGSEPVFDATEEQRARALADGSHDVLPMVSLPQLTGSHARIDLLHIDIQGGEADLIRDCLPLLAEKVAYILIGTHSREIEGRLFEYLLNAGWLLEMERPAILHLPIGAPVVTVDGVQGWRNPKLLPL